MKHFEDLFTTLLPSFLSNLEGLSEKMVTEIDNEELLRISIPKEIRKVVWQLYPLKSPGPDGF